MGGNSKVEKGVTIKCLDATLYRRPACASKRRVKKPVIYGATPMATTTDKLRSHVSELEVVSRPLTCQWSHTQRSDQVARVNTTSILDVAISIKVIAHVNFLVGGCERTFAFCRNPRLREHLDGKPSGVFPRTAKQTTIVGNNDSFTRHGRQRRTDLNAFRQPVACASALLRRIASR